MRIDLSCLAATLTAAITLASTASASPAPAPASAPRNSPSSPNQYETDAVSNAKCERKSYKVNSKADRTVFNTDAMGVGAAGNQLNQSQITQLFVNYTTSLVRNDTAFTDAFTQPDKKTVAEEFEISGVYCEPAGGPTRDALQILVHGIGFDGNYWNFQSAELGVPEEQYSYVYQASKAGFATFRYDRLGTGASQKPLDGYNTVQGATEVGILEAFASLAREGATLGGRQWPKTVVVGHSYGSVQANALSVARPDLVDGLLLTGYSSYGQGLPFYLVSTVYTQSSAVFPDRLGRDPPSYLVTGSLASGQQNFAYPYTVTPSADKQQRRTEQPVTQGSLFTIGTLGGVAQDFAGPVLVVCPRQDFIFALSDALQGGRDLADETVKSLYPKTSNGKGYVPDETGHGINFHSTATEVYTQMLDFLKDSGF